MLDVSIEILKKIDNAITHEVLEGIEERGKGKDMLLWLYG